MAHINKNIYSESEEKSEEFLSVVKNGLEALNNIKDQSSESFAEVKVIHKNADKEADKITELLQYCDKSTDTITDQETKLEFLTNKAEDLKSVIEKLLPGATSAGLASAFRERKESFKLPKLLWSGIFIASMVLLFVGAYIDPMKLDSENLSYWAVISYIFVRLPFAVPVIWLAIYSGRRHSQALRLEEEYAHKEVLSKSFEGYKVQLLEIESDSEEKEATINLIERTLQAIAVHPGRIYQGKHEDISPLSALSGLIRPGKVSDSDQKAQIG